MPRLRLLHPVGLARADRARVGAHAARQATARGLQDAVAVAVLRRELHHALAEPGAGDHALRRAVQLEHVAEGDHLAADAVVDVVDTQHPGAAAGAAAADAGLEADLVTRARHRHLAVDVEGQAGPVERAGDGAKRASVTVVEHDWKVLAGSHTAPSIGLRRPLLDQIDPANVSQFRGSPES